LLKSWQGRRGLGNERMIFSERFGVKRELWLFSKLLVVVKEARDRESGIKEKNKNHGLKYTCLLDIIL
jgi:hypothetical protein